MEEEKQDSAGVSPFLSLLLPHTFSLTCSGLMPHKEQAEANLLPAAAPGNKRVYGCTQMNSYSTLTTAKHMQILISGVQVRPFSQTQEALSNLSTSVHCISLGLFIHPCIACKGENKTPSKRMFMSYGVLMSSDLTLFSGFHFCYICSFFFFKLLFNFKLLSHCGIIPMNNSCFPLKLLCTQPENKRNDGLY